MITTSYAPVLNAGTDTNATHFKTLCCGEITPANTSPWFHFCKVSAKRGGIRYAKSRSGWNTVTM